MKKMALINPPMQVQNETAYICGHLGVGYIASFLQENGHPVDMFDCPSDRIHLDNLFIILKKNCYDIIGLSTYFYNWMNVLRITQRLRGLYGSEIFIFFRRLFTNTLISKVSS